MTVGALLVAPDPVLRLVLVGGGAGLLLVLLGALGLYLTRRRS